jgi:hypothetical protein
MLGKLTEVDIREKWPKESVFSEWLSQEESINLLSSEIGIVIKVIKTEAFVGNFSCDILAEEEETGRKIVIENQLEMTDHDHLGKLLTYASGFDAFTLIWIFKDIRDEHRRAIDWLNEKTDEDFNIFGIKMELWTINDSIPAPKFQVIVSPNDWAKTIKQSSRQQNLTETKLFQLHFWENFQTFINQNSKILRARKPRPQHWYDLSIGNSQAHISLIASTRDNLIRAGLYIPNNKALFKKLFDKKDQVENDLGFSLDWDELPNAKASHIKTDNKDVNFTDKTAHTEYYDWLLEKAESFYKVFPNYF